MDFQILRRLGEPMSKAELEPAAEAPSDALKELRVGGIGIRRVEFEVMANVAGDVTGTVCHY